MKDNVIQLPTRTVRPVVDKKLKKYDGTERRYCLHRAVEVDDNARIVECQHCGAPLDPIKVISDIAHDLINYRYKEDDYIALKKKIADLKDEEKRIKARIRRAQKK